MKITSLIPVFIISTLSPGAAGIAAPDPHALAARVVKRVRSKTLAIHRYKEFGKLTSL
jgi:hypothetical protein